MKFLELRGAEVAEGGVFTLLAIVAQEIGNLAAGDSAVLIFGHFQFSLDGSKARFHKRVVVAVVGACRATGDPL